MKKTIVIALLGISLLLPFAGFSQNRDVKTPEEKAQRMTERMSQKLALNEEQKTAFYEATLKFVSLTPDERKQNHQQYDARLKEILTADQFAKLQEMHERRRGSRPEKSRP